MEAPAQQSSSAAFPPLPNLVVSDIAAPASQPRVASPIGSEFPTAPANPPNGLPANTPVSASAPRPHHRPAPPNPNADRPASGPAHALAPFPPPAPESRPFSAAPQTAAQQGQHSQYGQHGRWVSDAARHATQLPRYIQHEAQPPMAFLGAATPSAKPQATRYVIMDPPSRLRGVPSPHQANRGYPSPTTDYARMNPKFVDDCGRITCAVQQSLPESVRRVVRDNWEKCLLGSEFHQAFILNATLHHSNPNTTRRAVRDFGGKMVIDCKHQLVKHFTSADIDDVAEQILSVASNDFLDKCLEKRLLTVEAKPLIQALARAERLGYESSDIVVEDDHERVIPHESSVRHVASDFPHQHHLQQQQQEQWQSQQQQQSQPHQQQQQPQQPQQQSQQQQQPSQQLQQPAGYSSNGRLQCSKCYRVFAHPSAYKHHTSKNVCSRPPPSAEGFRFSCQHCGQGFTTNAGQQYHNANKVCGDFLEHTPPTRGPGRPPQDRLSSGPAPPVLKPSPHGLQPTPPAILAQHAAAATAAAARSSPNPADPYGHLTPQQLESMQEELRDAELKYTAKFQDSETIPDSDERRAKLEGLRNSFGTKQSMIRKKYGVRLRERRRKAEIQAERERMGVSNKDTPGSTPSAAPVPRSGNHTPTPSKRSSGWTAANEVVPVEAASGGLQNKKRRRSDGDGDSAPASHQTPYPSQSSEPPPKRVAVAEMGGGLGESPATAAHRDPTLGQPPPPPSSASVPTAASPQRSARVEIHLPSSSSLAAARRPAKPSSFANQQDQAGYTTPPSRQSSSGAADGKRVPVDEEDSDSDDSDNDIPAKLPASVRQSLTPMSGIRS